VRGLDIIIVLAAAIPFAGAAAADKPEPRKGERLICRAAQRTLGTHIRAPRRCRSAEAWRQEDEKPLPITLQVNAPNDGKPRPQ